MKSYKNLLNEAMQSSGIRVISEEESKALKGCLLEFLDKILTISKKYNLCVMLTGGSCLGAVRHRGFIPWDDDLDLMMPRMDLERLIDLLKGEELVSNWELVYPQKDKDSSCLWLQIYNTDTRLITIDGERANFPNGCYVDIFPIEGVPSNKFFRKIKGWVANGLRLIANMVLDAQTPMTKELRDFYSSSDKLHRMMIARIALGRFFSIVSHKRWVWWYDRFVRNLSNKNYAGIPTGRNLYFRESHPSNVFFPPTEGVFEGRKVFLPSNPDSYLRALYGDYMRIPPVEKRESHFIKELSLPGKYYGIYE